MAGDGEQHLILSFFCLGAFLSGSVPFGLLLVRLAGRGDVRAHGSGNIGATNVTRVAGKRLGLLTLALDAGKGLLPVLLAKREGLGFNEVAAVALCAVAGHMFTPWLKLKGGKGVATALGVAAGWHAALIVPSFVIFLLTVGLTRYVSLGSLLGAVVLPLTLLLGAPLVGAPPPGVSSAPGLALWALISILIIARHHENIGRLLRGTESKIGASSKDR